MPINPEWADQADIGIPITIDKNWSDKTLKKKMNDSANEVCATMLILMELGGLNIPQAEKDFITEDFLMWSECFFELRNRGQVASRKVTP